MAPSWVAGGVLCHPPTATIPAIRLARIKVFAATSATCGHVPASRVYKRPTIVWRRRTGFMAFTVLRTIEAALGGTSTTK